MVGVAVWGAGWVSGEHLKAYRANPNVAVVAVGSLTKEEARAKAESVGIGCDVYDSLNEMLLRSDLDAVSVCTPHHLHVPNLEQIAAAGKHALVEKPLALDFDGLRRVKEAVRKYQVRAMVGFELHWSPYVQMLRNLVADGTMGDIVFLEAGYFSEQGPWWPGFKWGITREFGGSAISVAACHAVEFLCSFGGEVDEVFAYQTRRNRRDYEYEPTIAGVLRFKNGIVGVLSSSFEVHAPYFFPTVIGGSKGAVRDGRLHADRFKGQTDWIRLPTVLPDSPDVAHHPFQGEIDHFIECILSNREPLTSVTGNRSAEVGLALDRSAQCGTPVRLPVA
jgi:predicted dehydrogenase